MQSVEMHAADYTTETVHGERVAGGGIETDVDGKPTRIDIQQLRSRIPPHCLQPSTVVSLLYVAHDVAIFLALLQAALHLEARLSDTPRVLLCYAVYPYLAGLPLTGLWVLAHECGHGAFSANKLVAHPVGFVIHSALMSPYFAWRSSHGRHHQFANNLETDLNYVPPRRHEYKELLSSKTALEDIAEDAPLVVLLRILLQQVIGWPWYLLTHITAGPRSSPRPSRGWWDNSHFLPSSSLFRPDEFWSIAASDAGLAAAAAVLYALGQRCGSSVLVWTYMLPLMWVNHWIVMITYLHHTSPSLPKYTPESWTYLRGALATVDRDPGPVLRHLFHHIVDLHVVHHLFPRIPHYHAQEATDAIKPLLGGYYHVDRSSWWKALYIAFTQCQWVEPNVEKTAKAKVYQSAQVAGKKASQQASDEDERGILWYHPGPMPRPATSMRA